MAAFNRKQGARSVMAAAALGLLSAIFCYIVLAAAAAVAWITWTKLSSPGDPTAGWALMMLGPFFLLFDTVVSLVLGVVVACKVSAPGTA